MPQYTHFNVDLALLVDTDRKSCKNIFYSWSSLIWELYFKSKMYTRVKKKKI